MGMNIGRATKVALAQRNKSIMWLAEQLGTSRQFVSTIANRESASTQTIERLANVFDLTESEFIALGEFKSRQE